MPDCLCPDCCTSPEFTYGEQWRAFTEASLVASWEKERITKYLEDVAKHRGLPAAEALFKNVKRERRETK